MEERRMTRRGLFATLAAVPVAAIAAPAVAANQIQVPTIARLKVPAEFYLDIHAPTGFIVNVNDRLFHQVEGTAKRSRGVLFVPQKEFRSDKAVIRIASTGEFRLFGMRVDPGQDLDLDYVEHDFFLWEIPAA